MDTAFTETPQGVTLTSRLEQAPLLVPHALRYSLQLADALRAMHESGVIVGALEPAGIRFGASCASIEAAGSAPGAAYTAPETEAGKPVDVRSDIYAFGAVMYHLLTGRHPRSAGQDAPEPLENVTDAKVSRLVMQCLEKDPERRWQRMQTVYMELKLLNVAVRRSDPDLSARRGRMESELRQELSRVERVLESRVGTCDQSVVELQRATSETRDSVKVAVDGQEALRQALQKVEQSLASIREVTARLETGLSESSRTTAAVEEALSSQLAAVEEQVGAHTHSMEALHTAMAQTDDLLERVVESFDALQSLVLEHSDEK